MYPTMMSTALAAEHRRELRDVARRDRVITQARRAARSRRSSR